jgi:hypothetical protein
MADYADAKPPCELARYPQRFFSFPCRPRVAHACLAASVGGMSLLGTFGTSQADAAMSAPGGRADEGRALFDFC